MVEPETQGLVVERGDRVDRIPVPELPVGKALEAQILERLDCRKRVAAVARVEARAGPQAERPFEPVVRDLPALREQRARLPVGALREEGLVDRDARRV